MKIFASTAQQLPLHQNNQLLDTQNQLNPNNRLPNTQHQQLSYDWWQKLQALLRPRPPRPDNDGTDQDSGAAPSNIQCGVTSLSAPPINHLIVGGKEAQPGQFPWQVAYPFRYRRGFLTIESVQQVQFYALFNKFQSELHRKK